MTFKISVVLTVMVVLVGAIFPTVLAKMAQNMFEGIIASFGWFYLWVTLGFLVFSLYLAFGPYGKIRLGHDEDRPEYTNLTWFAMLFSAGMGIGLVFWGVAEPMFHYISPPMGLEGRSAEAARVALRYAFFHWGLHPWGIYSIMALALAYFNFRKNSKNLISATFTPLIGRATEGILGKSIDVFTIIATVFGVATSLGLGALQVNSGLSSMFGLPGSVMMQIIIIACVTVLYILSASTGLDKGIKILSNVNIVLAITLMLFVLVVGPTSFILDVFTLTFGEYVQNLLYMSLRMSPFTQGSWMSQWTLFYWAWWIAWAPFVGSFIARISRGRTIRGFILGVLIAPSIFGFFWFSIFGGTALNLEIFRGYSIGEAVQSDMASALFATLEYLPLGKAVALLSLLLIISFFITSADSATFVLGMFSTDGNPNPSAGIKLTWGILQSSIATVLLVSGGLMGLQQASIIASLPFSVIMIFMCISLWKSLRNEKFK